MVEKMPEKYKGEWHKGNGRNYQEARKWTPFEKEWVLALRKEGHTYDEIAESIGRTRAATQIKIKRLWKNRGGYNEAHEEDKRINNAEFLDIIKPETILDLYCGANNQYKAYKTTRNDKNESYEAEYHMDALKLLCKLYIDDQTYDYIDIDPFGSGYECFDLAIRMGNKGIAITLGEMGHKRFHRLDFVRRYYGIETLEDFTVENIIKEIQKIGQRHKKELITWRIKRWKNIVRIYLIIEPIKITEMWEK